MCTKTLIPKMSKQEMAKLYKIIKPIIRKDRKPYYLRELNESEISGLCYTWIDENDKYGDEVNTDSICVLDDVNMFHKYSTYMYFQPTVGEVLSQISKDLIDKVVAFEILDCLNQVQDGHHISIVRLYGKAE